MRRVIEATDPTRMLRADANVLETVAAATRRAAEANGTGTNAPIADINVLEPVVAVTRRVIAANIGADALL